jgi:hypothetical protein
MPFAKTVRRIQKPRPVQFFRDLIQWVETARYLGVTLIHSWPGRHTSTRYEERAAQRLGALGPIFNRRNGRSIRNSVLLYKQLNRPVMDYASGGPLLSRVSNLQVLQYKCFRK